MLMGSRTTVIMKIIIFPVNIDKFTMFFDKFLKNNVQINDCNKRNYHINLSALHSDMAAKKVFWKPRICPQLPAFPHAPHHAGEPTSPVGKKPHSSIGFDPRGARYALKSG